MLARPDDPGAPSGTVRGTGCQALPLPRGQAVRFQHGDPVQRLTAVPGLPDHLDIRHLRQVSRHAAAHDPVIVHQEDPDGTSGSRPQRASGAPFSRSRRPRGRDTVTVVPAPGVLVIVRSAPMIPARSAMVESPR